MIILLPFFEKKNRRSECLKHFLVFELELIAGYITNHVEFIDMNLNN